jgi:hypothetical protein
VFQIITNIEEEIELIDVDDDQPAQKNPNDEKKSRTKFAFSWKYILNVTSLLALIISMMLIYRSDIKHAIQVPIMNDVFSIVNNH